MNDRLRAALKRVNRKLAAEEWVYGLVGKITPSDPVYDVPGRSGFIYVRLRNANGAQTTTAARNDPGVPHSAGLPVRMYYEGTTLVIDSVNRRPDLATVDPPPASGVLIHKHDERYFTEDEHINVSAGAGDAGKPIVLNASGEVDETMLPSTLLTDTDDLPEGVVNLYFTDERAQDAVGAMLVDSTTIDFTYTDATPALTAIVIDDSITFAKMQNIATGNLLGRSTAGTGDIELITLTAFARTLIDDIDAAAARTTLGLGTMATQAEANYLLLAGRAGSQVANGGTASGESLTLHGSAHATKGPVLIQPTSGNTGIGTSDVEAWDASFAALQLGGASALMASRATEDIYLVSNAYYDGAWKRKISGLATQWNSANGVQLLAHGVSGAADSAISWVTDLRIAGDGGITLPSLVAKTTPVDADTMPLIDSAAASVIKATTWANIKATLKTYFDTLYATATGWIKADGSIPLTAEWDIGEDMAIRAERFEARDAEGLRLEDDGGNLGISIADGGTVTLADITVVGSGAGTPTLFLNGLAGVARDIQFASAGVLRWILRVTNTAEGGSNAGSDFQLLSRTDAGGILQTVLSVVRSTGIATWIAKVAAPIFAASTSAGLRVEDDGGNLGIFIEDATGNVGIKTATPVGALDVLQPTLNGIVQRLMSTATNDDPQESVFQGRATTTSATVTSIFVITVPASTLYSVEARVIARRTGGVAGTAEDGAYYIVNAVFNLVAGAANIIGQATTTIGESQAGWNAVFDVSTTTLRLRVTGAVDNNITWHATMRFWPLST